uniref:Rap guanine nucleotide exchange factor 5-like n=1 Tax=Gouania willdenowi TaxID=441366 RepID=A0A8C5D896_GOUWI
PLNSHLRVCQSWTERDTSFSLRDCPAGPGTVPTFDVPYFRYIDDEGTEGDEEWSSSRSLSSMEEDSSTDSVVSDRYVVVSGTPEKVLEHLLNDLTLDDDQGTTQVLNDFLITYPVFMSTSDLCQALHTYCNKRQRGKEEQKEVLERKQKVLHLISQWISLCRDFLREDEHVKLFMKTLYRYVLDDVYEYPALEKDVGELQKLYQMHRRHKALFHQLSLKENGLPSSSTQREMREVLCQVYITMDSYLSVRAHSAALAQDLVQAVAERIDYPHGELVLVAITYAGGRVLLQPQDRVLSHSLQPVGRLHVCRKDLGPVLNPFIDNAELQQRTACLLALNTWDVAVALTDIDRTIFDSMHEQELVYFTFSRRTSSHHTVALELLLQRCNEVQLWVMTEVLLCQTICKRIQIIKKFIKIAAHSNKACRHRLTHSPLRIDPSLNHKAYRDSFKKMKSPKIPFLPLLLKDLTFIHECNKTFHDNLVNFEKLHMIADMARLIRQCQKDPMGDLEVRSYVNCLHIIDNQQTLFDLSQRLEPRP